TIMGAEKPYYASNTWVEEWTLFNTGGTYGVLSYDLTRPGNNTWNSAQNMGQYHSAGLTGGPYGFLRGGTSGRYGDKGAGIFTISFESGPDGNFLTYSFRCVLR
ncbi:MAG: hypothetical protein ACO3UU_01830, partial [Minisyncoccia bacterium]